MISCKKATLLMTIREDRALSASERLGLSLHLNVCSLCRNYLAQTRLITKLMASAESVRTPGDASGIGDNRKNYLKILLNKKS